MKPFIHHWSSECWLAGTEKLIVINKRPVSLMWSLWEAFLQGQQMDALVQDGQGCISYTECVRVIYMVLTLKARKLKF